ncbi:hypothetical protein DB347_08215 [Opitutaceae bacterium EW11]|nr:hypothetical protein DB347_08215 [Opitutaceae bacterium EW11]
MIYLDVTKSAESRHQSGLMRVSGRLREELGDTCQPVIWRGGWIDQRSGRPAELSRVDWLLTPELFSESERPGWWSFLKNPSCRTAAIFHDAIPLRFPSVTWPQSVARQPEYMKMLAWFDRVLAVSRASMDDLVHFWKWQGTEPRGTVTTLQLGSDFVRQPRPAAENPTPSDIATFLCLGIVEPRKHQEFLVDVAEELLRRKLAFRMEFIGRVNPHFGGAIARRLKSFGRSHPEVRHRTRVSDEELLGLWRRSRATLFPTLAEGCGLPLLESLWLGVPCVCSDLPVLRENADGGGCSALPNTDVMAWASELQRLISDDGHCAGLRKEALQRPLPTWGKTAEAVREILEVVG